jgi:hypothetical protein
MLDTYPFCKIDKAFAWASTLQDVSKQSAQCWKNWRVDFFQIKEVFILLNQEVLNG